MSTCMIVLIATSAQRSPPGHIPAGSASRGSERSRHGRRTDPGQMACEGAGSAGLGEDVEIGRQRTKGGILTDLPLQPAELLVRPRLGLDHGLRNVVGDGAEPVTGTRSEPGGGNQIEDLVVIEPVRIGPGPTGEGQMSR